MVMTSNWPPPVAMSVVTRWRSTFSSRTTHWSWMSGCASSNWLESSCMMIMSPLLTVAIVTVSAAAGPAPTRRAPIAAAVRICLRISASLLVIGHLSRRWANAHSGQAPCQERIAHSAQKFRCCRHVGGRSELIGLQLENASCRGLIGDQARHETPAKRPRDRPGLATAAGDADGEALQRQAVRNCRQSGVAAAFDLASLRIEGPTGNVADRAEADQLVPLRLGDEAVAKEGDLGLPVERADPNQGNARAVGERANQLPRPLALEQGPLFHGVGHDGGRHRVAGSADPVGELHDDVEGTGAPVPGRGADERDDLVLRPLHPLDLIDCGAQRSPGAESEHRRDLG